MSVTTKKKIQYIACWVFLIVMLIIIYLPIMLIVVYSFSTAKNVGGTGSFTFKLYVDLFKNVKLMDAAKNTLIIGLISSVISTILGTISAVGIFYMKRGKKAVNTVSQITVVNAEIVTAVGFFLLMVFMRDTLMIPVKSGLAWLIFAHSMITLPYVILTVSPRLTQLNPNLFEAGMDLGAPPLRTMLTVIFPQLIKGMIAGFAIAFTLSLDDFVVTKMNSAGSGISTISTYIYDNLKRGLKPSVRALSTIIFAVVMIVLILVNVIGKKKAKKVL